MRNGRIIELLRGLLSTTRSTPLGKQFLAHLGRRWTIFVFLKHRGKDDKSSLPSLVKETLGEALPTGIG